MKTLFVSLCTALLLFSFSFSAQAQRTKVKKGTLKVQKKKPGTSGIYRDSLFLKNNPRTRPATTQGVNQRSLNGGKRNSGIIYRDSLPPWDAKVNTPQQAGQMQGVNQRSRKGKQAGSGVIYRDSLFTKNNPRTRGGARTRGNQPGATSQGKTVKGETPGQNVTLPNVGKNRQRAGQGRRGGARQQKANVNRAGQNRVKKGGNRTKRKKNN